LTLFDAYQVKGQFSKRHSPQGKKSNLMNLEN